MIRDVSMVLDSVTKVIVSNPRLITHRYFPLMRGEYRIVINHGSEVMG